jgi:sugar-specific transcriptional regulator TrmB
LSAERAEVKEIVRKEFINQVTAVEQENIRLREEIAEMRTRHKLELSSKVDEVARLMAVKEEQLRQVYNRYDTHYELKQFHSTPMEAQGEKDV